MEKHLLASVSGQPKSVVRLGGNQRYIKSISEASEEFYRSRRSSALTDILQF